MIYFLESVPKYCRSCNFMTMQLATHIAFVIVVYMSGQILAQEFTLTLIYMPYLPLTTIRPKFILFRCKKQLIIDIIVNDVLIMK